MNNLALVKQLANIEIEVYQTKRWRKINEKYYEASIRKVLDLLYKTIDLNKNFGYGILKKLARLKTFLINIYWEGKICQTTIDDLIKYFKYFINKVSLIRKKI